MSKTEISCQMSPETNNFEYCATKFTVFKRYLLFKTEKLSTTIEFCIFKEQIFPNRIFPVKNGKVALLRAPMVITYYIKLFRTETYRHKGISTLSRMGFFGAAHGWGGGKKAPLPKICHTYPTTIKLGTVVPYPRKIKKIYESRDSPLDQHFFHRKSANFAISKNTDIDRILIHNFYLF